MAVFFPPDSCVPFSDAAAAGQSKTSRLQHQGAKGGGSAEHAGREMGGIVGWMFWQGGELSVPCTDPGSCWVTQVRD